MRNAKNKKFEPYLVRYFKYRNDYYLIYTFLETDEKNFMKLYVVKVLEELGTPVAKNLTEDWEWNKIQSVVKQVLKEIKKNQPYTFQDANLLPINGMKIKRARSFKLLASLVDILSGDSEKEKIILDEKELVSNKETKPKLTDQPESIKQQKNLNEEKTEETKKNLEQNQPEVKLNFQGNEINDNSNPLDIQSVNSIKSDFNKEENNIDKDLYQKLLQENEKLKKQLLQYQVKYQTIKELITKDE